MHDKKNGFEDHCWARADATGLDYDLCQNPVILLIDPQLTQTFLLIFIVRS